ncbi:hypothetical protein O59_003422 [Cellvibrio sp. BR]|nr:hypothetical protein O59_003422 [Cellvibrio sp. BR]
MIRKLVKSIIQGAATRRCAAAQFVSRAYVFWLRKSIPQRATYKLPLCLTLGKNK